MKRAPTAVLVALALFPMTSRAQTIEQTAESCGVCHGVDGVPQQKDYPVIWGQQLGYLFIELRDFKTGARKNDLMSPIAQSLELSELMPLAQHFSEKPWPNLQQPEALGDVAAQAQRANASVVCTSCHQDGFRGDSTQPRLAGQNRDYLAKTMVEFRSGVRSNNPGMTDLMKAVSEQDIGALASYLAGLQVIAAHY